ncbi:MAG: DUF2723 domain-containing protein [Tidjanibacter sp.]|nr:DUF2723 domain-containing protein [Tidjanibacter sp.]
MKQYRKINNLVGWGTFLVSLLVYILTTEPSASFWDCGEFIPTSYKLEVGHPPGAPLFMMIANFFTQFAFGDVTKVALMVNIMSCTAAAATIMFLFWAITHIALRMLVRRGTAPTKGQTITIIGAGLVGAMAYAFTDTFWFSAVEAEVYALSSLMTAVVFWAILKWEEVADEPGNERWLVLIAYLMGLSIGVHILNLLTIPALAFVYYFRKTAKVSWKGLLGMTALSGVLILFVNSIVIPYTTQVGAWFDRMLNGIGLPVNAGFAIYVVLLFGALGVGIYLTQKRGLKLANLLVTCLTVILIGYSSYASVLIRAAANPPMNSNDPDNPYSLLYLLNREQYEAQPILSGVPYSAPIEDVTYKTKYYVNDKGKYVGEKVVSGYTYPDEFKSIFPRMWSSKEHHIEGYKSWGGVKGNKKIRHEGQVYEVPTFGENVRYFINYQLGFMYWRYFLWNFVGRQSDNQSVGEITDGQWMSGIKPFDEAMIGPQDNLPDEMANNKGRNHYYFLPLLLGLAGLLWQLGRNPRYFTVVAWLFVMMGVALVVYFNSPPGEPRERDYVYAGSFYAFCMWIGLGVVAVKEWIERLGRKKNEAVPAVVATVLCLSVPTILCAENWDDHDRSGRYVMRDMGYSYLNCMLPNSIVINFGDNDTFPLWYNQEVEGVRPDVRIMNQSYLGGGWYVDEMKYKYNDSEPVPFSFPKEKYIYANAYIFVEDVVDYRVPIQQAMAIVRSEAEGTKIFYDEDLSFDFLPQHKLSLPVNKENVLKSGIVDPKDEALILDSIDLDIKGNTLEKPEFMILDLLANFNWERPIYFVQPTLLKNIGILDYLQFDGFAYRLVPIKTKYESATEIGRIDSDYLYDVFMNRARYGNVKDESVYIDNFSRYNINSTQVRGGFARLAEQLALEGKNDKAVEVLDRVMEELPLSQLPHNYQSFPLIDAYYMAGATDKGDALARHFAHDITQKLYYYFTFPDNKQDYITDELLDEFKYLEHLTYSLLLPNDRMELVAECDKSLEIAELFLGMTRNEQGTPESNITPVHDGTRDEFLDSIDGIFIVPAEAEVETVINPSYNE